RAADQVAEDAADSYRAALDLVTGRPFTYANAARRSFGWVDVEHHATTWETRIGAVAKAYAELSLDLDRRDEALGVLHRLLQAMPLNTNLVEALMRTHLAGGDRAAADGVYRAHNKALDHANLGDPDDAVEQLRLQFTTDA
ncbi:MAG TPA: bacterial transcriptional activator domain-containing protein, partial [Nocardioidaceae bacterium]|nr:bacterial transcriptional activator domain-containing protein [Nocardioidaceae bacterium]